MVSESGMNQSLTPNFSDLVTTVTAAGLYSKLCSIKRNTYTSNDIGELIVTGPTAIATNVPCQFGVPTASWDHRAGMEKRKPELTEVRKQRQINLNQYLPTIEQDCVATVDAVDYNILSVVHDSQNTFTELLVELVTI